jgi:hypothetical protein
MSQNFEIIKYNDIINDTDGQKNIDNLNSLLDFDLLIDPLFDSFFKFPATKDFEIEPYYSEDSLLKNSLIMVNPISNSIFSTYSINSTVPNNITTSSNNEQSIINTYPFGLTISSPTSDITTCDNLSSSVINSNSWTILHEYHLDLQHNVWIQSRDLFEEKFNETFLHMEGIVCPNSSFWFQFSAITSFNITLNWWNGGPKVIDRTIHFQIIRKSLVNRSNSSTIQQ